MGEWRSTMARTWVLPGATGTVHVGPICNPTHPTPGGVSATARYARLRCDSPGVGRAAPPALDFLGKRPRLSDAQAARIDTLKSLHDRHNGWRPDLVEGHIQPVHSVRTLMRDAAVVELAARVMRPLVAGLDGAPAQASAAHPEPSLFRERPGDVPTRAPRLLEVFGTVRDRSAQARSMQRYCGGPCHRGKRGDAAGCTGGGTPRPS